MEVFRFNLSDSGKLFDIKLLQIENEFSREYGVLNKFKPIKRVMFYALVNGRIEIVNIHHKVFAKMIEKGYEYNKSLINKNDDFYFRFDVRIKEMYGKEYVDYDFEFIPSKLYKQNLTEVQTQINEFEFTLEDAVNKIKDEYSKDSHWSNNIILY
jgi:hypothetical protein